MHHGAIGLLCVTSSCSLGYSAGEFQALQLIVIAASGDIGSFMVWFPDWMFSVLGLYFEMMNEYHMPCIYISPHAMGLLPDTYNCGLRMRRECRERFSRHQVQRKPQVSNPAMHHGTCVTHVRWCMSGSLIGDGWENVPGIPGACAIRNFAYLARGPLRLKFIQIHLHICFPFHNERTYQTKHIRIIIWSITMKIKHTIVCIHPFIRKSDMPIRAFHYRNVEFKLFSLTTNSKLIHIVKVCFLDCSK